MISSSRSWNDEVYNELVSVVVSKLASQNEGLVSNRKSRPFFPHNGLPRTKIKLLAIQQMFNKTKIIQQVPKHQFLLKNSQSILRNSLCQLKLLSLLIAYAIFPLLVVLWHALIPISQILERLIYLVNVNYWNQLAWI